MLNQETSQLLKKLIEKYNVPVPRYTSYPPANHFLNNITQEDFFDKISESNSIAPQNITFYVHIPFCRDICFYCGCNATRLSQAQESEEYFDALKKEIQIVKNSLDNRRKISQIHFGGGTPNSVDVKHIAEIIKHLKKDFDFIEDPEIAIECHPALLDYDYLNKLIEIGVNRISLGIQDFIDDVLKGVNRKPSMFPIEELLQHIRDKYPYVSVNFDFIYGLPGQSVDSFSDTIGRAAKLKPNRLVTFSYAHVPWTKKHQKILDVRGLPSSNDKMEMFLASRNILLQNGYLPIGLDHYVLPQDELNAALQTKQLHRNFQGYCTKRTTGQVYAFGVSSISQLQNSYFQNTKHINKYIASLKKDIIPVEKSYFLSKSELIIKELITELMCNYYLDIVDFTNRNGINDVEFRAITKFEEEKLKAFERDGLIEYREQKLKVTETGGLFIRNIAATFDPAYEVKGNIYSKSV